MKDYSYSLPDNRIAKQPLRERDNSKLLVCKGDSIFERPFKQISEEIPENNLIVRNNTRVIQARLTFRKSTGASIEILCLEPHSPSTYEQNFAQAGEVEWICLVGNAKKWKSGDLEKMDATITGIAGYSRRSKYFGSSFWSEYHCRRRSH